MSTETNEGSREYLLSLLEEYTPALGEDCSVQQRIVSLIRTVPKAAVRETYPAHLTASGWVVNHEHTRVLLIFHKKLQIWIQPGGHADGEYDLKAVAVREVREETGIVADASMKGIFDLDIHDIPEWKDVPRHQHFDVRFLLYAEPTCSIFHNEEVMDTRWFGLSELHNYTNEKSILRMRDKVLALSE